MTEEKTKRGPEPVPFIAYESAMARADRTNKRLLVATAAAFAVLIATNAAWIVRRE